MKKLAAKENPIRDLLRQAAHRVLPRKALETHLRLKMLREARRLVALREQSEDPAWIDEVMGSYFFRPLQKMSEVLRLVELIRVLKPLTVCEIGAANGGTAFLFAHAAAPRATIVSVDLEFKDARRTAMKSFARSGQRVICVEGDSHSTDTLDAVRKGLESQPLDLLFLDGDHAYEGVTADFRTYAALVRPGGLIVLHDIVPDFRARYGKETPSDSGGVPQFWRELKSTYTAVEEIVEDEEQDGFGIGVVHWSAPAL